MNYLIFNQSGVFLQTHNSEVKPEIAEDQVLVIVDDTFTIPFGSSAKLKDGKIVIFEDPQLYAIPKTTLHVWDGTSWVIPIDTQWKSIRERRAELLLASDWTQLPDVPLATKEAWATYRQALRDVTLQPDPFNITWPTAPQ